MKASEISRHLHHVRADYDNGVWRFSAHLFDNDGIFVAACGGSDGNLLIAAANMMRNAIEQFNNDEITVVPS